MTTLTPEEALSRWLAEHGTQPYTGRHVLTERDEADDRLIELAKADREFGAIASGGECDREAERYFHDERGAINTWGFITLVGIAVFVVAIAHAIRGNWDYATSDAALGLADILWASQGRRADRLKAVHQDAVRRLTRSRRFWRNEADWWRGRYERLERELRAARYDQAHPYGETATNLNKEKS